MHSIDYRIPAELPRGLTQDAMPNDFGSPCEEVWACQNEAALFDYSFLLRIRVHGPDAIRAVSNFCGRDFSSLAEGTIQYALTTNEEGWLISDLTVWRTGPETLEIVTGRAEDLPAIACVLGLYHLEVFDLSSQTAVLALQGPEANDILTLLTPGEDVSQISSFEFRDLQLFGSVCRVGRLGFTGLDGVEIVCSVDDADKLWCLLARRARPAGFIAADQLRLLADLPLFTKEFAPPVNASDIGLKRIRNWAKDAVNNKPAKVLRICFSAVAGRKAYGQVENYAAWEWTSGMPFPPRPETLAVTSLAHVPACDTLIGMGYVDKDHEDRSLSDLSGFLDEITITKKFPNP